MTKTRDLADLGGGFIQAGTGAVQRTVESKLQDVVSVKDFGAVGNGVVDDTAAIQAAMAAGSGRRVFFPSGVYKVTSSINLYTNSPTTKITICGEGGTVIDASGLSGFVFVLSTPNGTYEYPAPHFEDLTINCQRGIQLNSLTGGFTDDSSSQNYLMRPRFSRVILQGSSSAGSIGLQLSKCFNASISECVIKGFETNIKFKGCDFSMVNHSRVSTATTLINDESSGSFGTGTVITKCDMGNVATGGWFVVTSARESEISNTMMENFSSSIGGFIDITGGFTHRISSNRLDSSATNVKSIRCVPTVLALIVKDNQSVSNNPAAAEFTSEPTYFYNAVLKRQVIFQNNSFGAAQLINGTNQFLRDADGFSITPNTSGFDYADQGGSVVITTDNAFSFSGSGPYTFRIPADYRFSNGLVFVEAKAAVDGQQVQLRINGVTAITLTLTTQYRRYFVGLSGVETYAFLPLSSANVSVRSISFKSYSGSPSFTLPVNFSSGSGTGRTATVSIPCFSLVGSETMGIRIDTYLFTQGGSDDSTINGGTGLANGSTTITTNSLLSGTITTKASVANNTLTITFGISDTFNGGSNAIVRGSLGVSLYSG